VTPTQVYREVVDADGHTRDEERKSRGSRLILVGGTLMGTLFMAIGLILFRGQYVRFIDEFLVIYT
jgi:hypothetical protein